MSDYMLDYTSEKPKESPGVLSERELELLRLVAQGFSNKEIARELFISANTVKVHLRNIFAKLKVSSRVEATMVAVRRGWVTVGRETFKGGTAVGPAEEAFSTVTAMPQPAPVVSTAPWQRIFLLAALAVVVVALAWTWPLPTSPKELPENPLADNPSSVVLAGPPSLPTRWQEEVPMAIARDRLAVVAVDGQVYAIGGKMPGSVTGVVEAYEPIQQTWTLRATKPVPVANVCGVALGGKIYVPGGLTFSDQVTNVMEVYDPAADRWEQASPLPEPRAAYALAGHGEKLYLFGGTDGQQDVSTVLIYDPATDEWHTGPPMPTARAFAGAAMLNDQIFVVGGYTDDHELDVCQVYLPLTGEWQSCAPMLEGRGGLGLVAVGRNLFVIGGGWKSYLTYSQQYDPVKDTWFRFETPVLGQWRNVGAAELNGKVYVVGGMSDEFLNVNLTYQAVYKSFIPSIPR
jgi:DNA-binding CsgD family transcriptional regulator/N-acetylneuraminic acid mutarotase